MIAIQIVWISQIMFAHIANILCLVYGILSSLVSQLELIRILKFNIGSKTFEVNNQRIYLFKIYHQFKWFIDNLLLPAIDWIFSAEQVESIQSSALNPLLIWVNSSFIHELNNFWLNSHPKEIVENMAFQKTLNTQLLVVCADWASALRHVATLQSIEIMLESHI